MGLEKSACIDYRKASEIMKIAVIGSGISGNTLAWHLQHQHQVTLFEAQNHLGGHTHTHSIDFLSQSYAVDTGFIVFNHQTYPNFVRMLRQLNVAEQESAMSFSVSDAKTGLEYNGTSINSLFAQRKNLLNWKFIRMIQEILRFNREAPKLLDQPSAEQLTMRDYLAQHQYHQEFIQQYIVPMGAAIWSAEPSHLLDFPAIFFIRFFKNHGMLNVNDRPTWYVIKGGSARYVEALMKDFSGQVRIACPVQKVKRYADYVRIDTPQGSEQFDWVFFACHSDQALQLLDSPSELEQQVLSAIPYQENEIALHYDHRILPKKRLAWAAWNYHIPAQAMQRVAVTYNMNILQNLDAATPLLVTLNYLEDIDPSKIIKRLTYHHPIFNANSIWAQQQHQRLNQQHRTCFAGAYWGNGFHEDGVVSALQAIKHFEQNHAK